MSTTTFRFSAMDTWFFRESRPMETIGGSELVSVFPAPPRTLLGAVRTAIGDASGVDWKAFERDPQHSLRNLIGFGNNLGPLRLSGPWLNYDGERLYPVPLFLLAKKKGKHLDYTRLSIGQAAKTHLGRVRLSELPKGKQGYKPLERAWITGAGLEAVLSGGLPSAKEILHDSQLFEKESRLGIARSNVRRTAEAGLLYQTCHLRPKSDLSIEADITLADGSIPPTGLVRLGGEGRLAHLSVATAPTFPQSPTLTGDTDGIVLLLLTPGLFGGQDRWLPPGFVPAEENGVRVWKGSIADVPLTVHAAVLGKAKREGGWDMANRQPRAVQSLVPAGSAYFATVDGNFENPIQALNNSCIGEDQELGRGRIACGLWSDN